MSQFWPPADPPQHAYERLRSAVLGSDRPPDELAAARFARRGLAGLIDWPDAEPVFTTLLIGAARAAWTPYADPRVTVLAATYRLLLDTGQHTSGQRASGQRTTSYPDTVLAAGQQTMSRLNARSRS